MHGRYTFDLGRSSAYRRDPRGNDHKGGFLRIKALGAACVLTSLAMSHAMSPARADDFCSRLKTIVGGTSGGFENAKGAADDVIPGWFAGTVTLPGADDCVVDTITSKGGTAYRCAWPQKDEPSIASAYAQVVQQTDACITGARKSTEPDRTIWRKPHAWSIIVGHRKVMKAKPGALSLVVEKN